jgi:hypothetical protein
MMCLKLIAEVCFKIYYMKLKKKPLKKLLRRKRKKLKTVRDQVMNLVNHKSN